MSDKKINNKSTTEVVGVDTISKRKLSFQPKNRINDMNSNQMDSRSVLNRNRKISCDDDLLSYTLNT